MSKAICNILIILSVLVCLGLVILAVIQKLSDWKIYVFPLAFATGILLMYQSVIYKGKKDKTLLGQIPFKDIKELIKKQPVVTAPTLTPTPPTTQINPNG